MVAFQDYQKILFRSIDSNLMKWLPLLNYSQNQKERSLKYLDYE